MTKPRRKASGYGNAQNLKLWTPAEMMGSPEFRAGMDDVWAGRWNQDLADKTFRYERGRQYAILTKRRKVKVTPTGYAYKEHVAEFMALWRSGDVR